jgi:GNAT superfamily N-acetyltransferase
MRRSLERRTGRIGTACVDQTVWVLVVDRAKTAWASLVGAGDLDGTHVMLDPTSPLCPRGWIGILSVDDGVVAAVPRGDLRDPVVDALNGLSPSEATDPEVVLTRLPPIAEVMGPAALFYADEALRLVPTTDVREVVAAELDTLFRSVPQGDLDESGLSKITSSAFVVRTVDGDLAAACGYRHWPNGVAHLCALTDPAHRRHGHGRAVAAAAISRAQDEHLLPQWRARPPASRALARSLGLIELGAQLNLRPG